MSIRRKSIAVPDWVDYQSFDKLLVAAGFPVDAKFIREDFIWNQAVRVLMFEHESFHEMKDIYGMVEHVALDETMKLKW